MEEQDEEGADSKHRQTGDSQSHHGAAAEGNLQGLGKGGLGRLGGADVRLGGDLHSQISGEGREEATDDKSGDDQDARMGRNLGHLRKDAEAGSGKHHVDGENPVFGLEEGHGALGDVTGNAAHLGVAGILLGDPACEDSPVNQGHEAQDRKDVNEMFHSL